MSQYPLARTIIPHSIGAAGPLLAPAHADTAHRLRQRQSCGAARRARIAAPPARVTSSSKLEYIWRDQNWMLNFSILQRKYVY